MNPQKQENWPAAVAGALLILMVGAASAQEPTGSLFGVVRDLDGGVLPGVTIELSGLGEHRTQASDRLGQFRYLRLDPGDYSIRATLDGFAALEYQDIEVRVARSSSVDLALTPALQEVITVTSESPLLDTRRLSQGTHVTEIELQTIPTSRDPWGLMSQTPGVNTNTVDVGGSRNFQATITGPGVQSQENQWRFDGVNVENFGGGESGTYYNFDDFEQVEISTGGNDITRKEAGVSINLVTRRGTNQFRGSARFLITDKNLFLFFKESSPDVDPDDLPAGQEGIVTDQLNRIEDIGFEAGGPVLLDRLWFWGSFGQNDVSLVRTGGQPLERRVESSSLKINAQPVSANSLVGWWNSAEKVEPNRGAGPSRSPASTWLFTAPTEILKIEDSHVFSGSFFLTGMWAKVDAGIAVTPNACVSAGGCDEVTETLWDSNGVWQNSFLYGGGRLPSQEWLLDGSNFFSGGTSSHELKFGAGYRTWEYISPLVWPGRNVGHIAGEVFGAPPGPVDFVFAQRGGEDGLAKIDYTSLWLQDTISLGAWTINAGLRYDHQAAENVPTTVAANPAFFDVMPAVEFAGNEMTPWDDILPRLGVTFALGDRRRTLLQASYARFSGQCCPIERINPIEFNYATFLFIDGNDNNMWDGPEEPYELVDTFNFDPEDPLALETLNENDPNLEAPLTDEVMVGVEHSFFPELVAGIKVTWRNTSHWLETRDRIRDRETGEIRLATEDDYQYDHTVTVTHPDGQPYDVDFYRLREDYAFTSGSLLTNGDRDVEYLGATATLTKRLADRWMLRGYLNYGRPEWDVPASYGLFQNPMNQIGDDPGELWGQRSDGRLGGVMQLHSQWSFNVNGLYQIAPDRPWGFDVAGNIFGREGYPIPYEATSLDSTFKLWTAQATAEPDDFRYDDLYTIDLRFEKEFAATGALGLTFSADLFNALNSGVVLTRRIDLNGPRANWVEETLSPRIWRLGVRLNWR